jgi:hypothetical protein
MTNCEYCTKTILFGGIKNGQFIFCSKSCEIMAQGLIESYNLPEQLIQPEMDKIHQSSCPKCSGKGPVDIHYYNSIWSAIYVTRWATKNIVACRKCGLKKQIYSTVFSFLFGWWGFPWGVIFTPIQIGKNIKLIVFPFSTLRPSNQFEKILRLLIVERLRKEKGLYPDLS